MKETLDKIKEKYKKNWLEILLMVLFVCAALALNASQIAEETAEVFGRSANKPVAELVQKTSEAESEEEQPDEETKGEKAEEPDKETEGEEAGESDKETESKESEKAANTEENDTEQNDAEEAVTGKNGIKKAGTGKADAERTGLGNSEETSGKEKDWDAEQASEYEVFTLKDTKRVRDLYPIYLPGISGPVEYQTLLEQPELAEYQGLVAQDSIRNLTLLEKMIENRISEYDGDWSVYVKNLSTDEGIVINNQPMKSASVMKLFIMGTVYKAIEAGELERTDEVMSLVNSMITVSDNEASNQLLYLLGDASYEEGIAEVDEFIREYGFSEMTVEYNGFNNSATVTDSSNFNQVSAQDCGKLLEDIYRRNWVSRSVSNEIEEMLLNQHTRYKIPAGLPEGVLCGNKTGEMDTTENDAAIIYAEDCDYILVVLSSDWNSKDEAIARITSLSGMVYEFLN